jgi:hypothetical protein
MADEASVFKGFSNLLMYRVVCKMVTNYYRTSERLNKRHVRPYYEWDGEGMRNGRYGWKERVEKCSVGARLHTLFVADEYHADEIGLRDCTL